MCPSGSVGWVWRWWSDYGGRGDCIQHWYRLQIFPDRSVPVATSLCQSLLNSRRASSPEQPPAALHRALTLFKISRAATLGLTACWTKSTRTLCSMRVSSACRMTFVASSALVWDMVLIGLAVSLCLSLSPTCRCFPSANCYSIAKPRFLAPTGLRQINYSKDTHLLEEELSVL